MRRGSSAGRFTIRTLGEPQNTPLQARLEAIWPTAVGYLPALHSFRAWQRALWTSTWLLIIPIVRWHGCLVALDTECRQEENSRHAHHKYFQTRWTFARGAFQPVDAARNRSIFLF